MPGAINAICNLPLLIRISQNPVLSLSQAGLLPRTLSRARVLLVRIQNSIVKSLVPKLPALVPKLTSASVPLKLKACPPLPGTYLTPPAGVPLSRLVKSRALLFACHQLIILAAGTVAVGGGVTLTVAFY